MAPKQADLNAQRAQIEVTQNIKDEIILSNGEKIRIGMMMNPTQDKLNEIYVEYESCKKALEGDDLVTEKLRNDLTRRYYAKCAAAIILNNYLKIKFFFGIKWRILYYLKSLSGDDYFNIIALAKKKATEQQYLLAMALLVTMTDMWTTMTKKEAEEYRAELDLVREHQSLKSSPN